MFTEQDRSPRLFALPPGADFPARLAEGLIGRSRGLPPEALARCEVLLNTGRMRQRLAAELAARGALLLPRLRLLSDIGAEMPQPGLAPPVSGLRRRLELARLVSGLIAAQPGIAPRSAAFDLADSLAALLDEMHGEGVSAETLAGLDVADHAAHWERSLAFVRLAGDWADAAGMADTEARQRHAAEALVTRWRHEPPDHPVIIAGSTGSRGATALLMQAVAGLPQGALVLPGFDFDMPAHAWRALDAEAAPNEDHPQHRLYRIIAALGQEPAAVRPWLTGQTAPHPARNRLISLALRPPPVTDQWRGEGSALGDLTAATQGLGLIEAPDQRAEALAVALRLRAAAEAGRAAMLITPDRLLARRVAVALDRWGIRPDDSAGRPLGLTAPGRFLRLVAGLFGQRLSAQALLTLLKHPITHSGGDRGTHLLLTRGLERQLRRFGPPFPDPQALERFAARSPVPGAGAWAGWLAGLIEGLDSAVEAPLATHVARHRALAEALAAGPAPAHDSELWREAAGERALAVMDELTREAEHGGSMLPADHAALLASVMARHEVRESVQTHPGVLIRGTREAREAGVELAILGGLNEGGWPETPAPDPWLSRLMRLRAGLLLPERRVGLSAHDFQQAAGLPEVVLSRSRRDAEAETVPARWLNRLVNLLGGLHDAGGPVALERMRAEGRRWLDMAAALEADFAPVPPEPRPAPCPPAAARPRELPVTAISRLIRDPYAVYARYILGLRRLDPLHRTPDALLRGSVLHKVFERFVAEGGLAGGDRAMLMRIGAEVLETLVPWAAARRLWLSHLDRSADWFLTWNAEHAGTPVLTEKSGSAPLDGVDFTLTARPDRIDELADDRLLIIDYKTGAPPSPDEQRHFEKQLPLEAAMAERGGFAQLGRRGVAGIAYLGLGASPKALTTVMSPEDCATVWAELEQLVAAYARPDQGYAARRATRSERDAGDYDHLARFGEWELTDQPVRFPVGGGND